MARKSKADAVAEGKVSKVKTGGKSTAAKTKKVKSAKKSSMERIETPAAAMPVSSIDPTSEQIQMRAYFISERRRRFDLPGDANSDWLEAKRQLLAETRH